MLQVPPEPRVVIVFTSRALDRVPASLRSCISHVVYAAPAPVAQRAASLHALVSAGIGIGANGRTAAIQAPHLTIREPSPDGQQPTHSSSGATGGGGGATDGGGVTIGPSSELHGKVLSTYLVLST